MAVKIRRVVARDGAPGDPHDQPLARFQIADWVVDPTSGRLSRGGEMLRLEPKVMEVLVYLAHRPGQVVTREALEASVWAGSVVSYDALTGAIQKLRKAFKDDPRQPRIIETLSKKGYRLVAPVQALQVRPRSASTPPGDSPPRRVSRRPPRAVLILLVLTALVGAATLLWMGPKGLGPDPAASAPPAIAVLPFDNLSRDPQQAYLADGITDDLITALAKNPGLLVIARDSSFFYKDRPLDVRQVAGRLHVHFIVQGSVRRLGEVLRINAQLVDAEAGTHVWADRYDGAMADMFRLQDEITRGLTSALAVEVSPGQRQDLGPPPTTSPRAYDRFLRGRHGFYLYANKDQNRKARALFQDAIAFDPEFALAYAMLGWTHVFDAMNGWSAERERSLAQALELANQAVSREQALPVAYFVRGLAYREQGEYVKALVEAEKAIAYDPNYANAHVLLATLLYYAGRPEEGLARIQKAIQLNPHHPYNYSFHLGQALFVLRRNEAAIAAFAQGIESNPASERLHVWLTAAYAQAGHQEEAEWEAGQVLTLNPEFSVARMRESFPFKDPADLEHFLDSLRKAGLPS
jgi:adenylate cyclase